MSTNLAGFRLELFFYINSEKNSSVETLIYRLF